MTALQYQIDETISPAISAKYAAIPANASMRTLAAAFWKEHGAMRSVTDDPRGEDAAYDAYASTADAVYMKTPTTIPEAIQLLEIILMRDQDNIEDPILIGFSSLMLGLRRINNAL